MGRIDPIHVKNKTAPNIAMRSVVESLVSRENLFDFARSNWNAPVSCAREVTKNRVNRHRIVHKTHEMIATSRGLVGIMTCIGALPEYSRIRSDRSVNTLPKRIPKTIAGRTRSNVSNTNRKASCFLVIPILMQTT